MDATADGTQDVPSHSNSGNETKYGQEGLGYEGPSECHTIILYKGDTEPVGDNDALMERHVGFHPYLHDLVDNQEAQED